jgi:hypothetical protein
MKLQYILYRLHVLIYRNTTSFEFYYTDSLRIAKKYQRRFVLSLRLVGKGGAQDGGNNQQRVISVLRSVLQPRL